MQLSSRRLQMMNYLEKRASWTGANAGSIEADDICRWLGVFDNDAPQLRQEAARTIPVPSLDIYHDQLLLAYIVLRIYELETLIEWT